MHITREIRPAALAALITLGLACGAAARAAEPATLFYNAHVFTAEPDAPYADAVAISGGRIVAVGERGTVEAAAGAGARRVDLHGKFLMPGMLDAHAHPIWGGITLVMASYSDTRDVVPDLLAYVEEQARKKTSVFGDVLAIYDVDLGFWSKAAQIEAALSHGAYAKTPIVLFGSDGHTGWVNAAARKRAGITPEFLRGLGADERRYYGFDAKFAPNGFVVDAGLTRVQRSLPPPSLDVALAAAHAAMRYMNGLGITGWLDAMASGEVGGGTPATLAEPGMFPVYAELARRGELTAHVAAYPVIRPDGGFQQLDVVEDFQQKYRDIPDLTVPGLKVFADGVVEYPSQTAALTRPYVNSGKTTPTLFDHEKFKALVTEADRRGLVVHVHAIGDEAVKAALDAFEAARRANPTGSLPHTITHLQFVDDEDVPRFARLKVFAAVQLLWAVADPSTIEIVKPYIDPAIYRTMYPARSLLEAGAQIAGASDWPVSSANPFEAIFQAETRSGPQGVLLPEQRMPRLAMLYAYTRNAARVLDQLDDIGTLAPGKRADLVLLDRDVLTVGAPELKDTKVVWTMFEGRIVAGTAPY